MSSEAGAKSVAAPASSESQPEHTGDVATEAKNASVRASASNGSESAKGAASATQGQGTNGSENKHTPQGNTLEDKRPIITGNSTVENQDITVAPTADSVEDNSAAPAIATPASNSKSKSRRKSAGVPEHKTKKPNKKASKAKLSHIDAKPGEHYYIKLKGYPLWPGIICDESMLPTSLISTRPVTAARPDGFYRADYEDGGKNVHDRTFPVMYLATNEFGWIPNYDLVDMDLDEVGKVDQKMRKDLYEAHKLAAEKHDLAYYKKVLQDFQEARQAEIDAKAAASAAKKVSGKGKKKSKAAVDVEGEDNEDVDMADVGADATGDGDASEKKPKSKKRKAVADIEDTETPKRSDSVKKPKFKPITGSTPKTANGNAPPKSTAKKDQLAPKSSKSKGKKSTTNGIDENGEGSTPKNEPEPSPEEKKAKKEKEILFLRHKLQKGLLTRDQQPKEEEMKGMSEFISKLEGYAELDFNIIKTTKINKVLKAILKLPEIPKEEEFNFKGRSKDLLDKWTKILEADGGAAATSTPVPADKTSPKEFLNGLSTSKVEDKENKDTKNNVKTEELISAVDADAAMPDIPGKESTGAEERKSVDPIKKSALATPVEAA